MSLIFIFNYGHLPYFKNDELDSQCNKFENKKLEIKK